MKVVFRDEGGLNLGTYCNPEGYSEEEIEMMKKALEKEYGCYLIVDIEK